MLRHGIARDVVTALAAMSRAFRGWGGSAPVTQRAARRRRAGVRRPHAAGAPPPRPLAVGHGVLRRRARQLLAGDHLIKHISSNPLISQPLGGRSGEPGSGRPRSLLMYLESLRATREMPIDDRAPGPRRRVRRPRGADRRPLRDARAAGGARSLGLIAEQPRTAHDIAQAIWGNVAVTQAYLTLSEVLGHVDLLLERGEVVEVEHGGVVQFAPRSGRQSRSSSSRCSSRWPCCPPRRGRSTCRTRSCSWSAARSWAAPWPAGGRRSTRTSSCVIFLPPLLYSRRVLREPARPARRPAADLAALDRARPGDDGRGRRGRARADRRPLVAGGVRARRDRRADRPRRRDRDRAPARRAAPARLDPRRRGAGQRRHRARRLPDRDRRRSAARLLAARRGLGLPVEGGGRDRGRARRRLRDRRRSASGSTTRWSRTRSAC